MSIQRQLTQLERDLQWLDLLIFRSGESLHHHASNSTSVNYSFWNDLPTDRLLDVLNDDVDRSLSILNMSEETNTQINRSLDFMGIKEFGVRAPTEPGRSDIAFDGEKFICTSIIEGPET
jgi:hypothetical protein